MDSLSLFHLPLDNSPMTHLIFLTQLFSLYYLFFYFLLSYSLIIITGTFGRYLMNSLSLFHFPLKGSPIYSVDFLSFFHCLREFADTLDSLSFFHLLLSRHSTDSFPFHPLLESLPDIWWVLSIRETFPFCFLLLTFVLSFFLLFLPI